MLDAEGLQCGTWLVSLDDDDDIDSVLGVIGEDRVLDPVGPVTSVVRGRGFAPRQRRQAQPPEEPRQRWEASVWRSVRQQLDELLAEDETS